MEGGIKGQKARLRDGEIKTERKRDTKKRGRLTRKKDKVTSEESVFIKFLKERPCSIVAYF